jgi:hypothetical protein
MAITKLTNTITDTNTKYSVQHTGLADDATQLASSLWANLSALKYASATVTLASAPTTNLCIGEVLTTNDGTAIFLRVTDFTAGATTFKAYKVTSATDITPLGWTAETATDVGTGKTLTGGVSGLCSSLTHASTRLAIAAPKINLRKRLVVSSGVGAPCNDVSSSNWAGCGEWEQQSDGSRPNPPKWGIIIFYSGSFYGKRNAVTQW